MDAVSKTNTHAAGSCGHSRNMTVAGAGKARRRVMGPASLAGILLMVSACASGGGLWESGDDIQVQARTTLLEKDVGTVSEDYRTLRDRFNALEELYVDLARELRMQRAAIAELRDSQGTAELTSQAQAKAQEALNNVSGLRVEINRLQRQLRTVERASLANTTALAANVSASTEEGGDDADLPVVDAEQQSDPFYGVHLASYRTRDQVPGAWEGFQRRFGDMLSGLVPVVYVQSQEGIGTFLRLIVGPFDTRADAGLLCEALQGRDPNQYCRTSEYQGDPVGG